MSAKWTISLAEPHCSACANKDGCTVFPNNDDGEFANVCADWKCPPAPKDNALVDDIGAVILTALKDMRFTGVGDHWETECRYIARAVLAHLEGRSNV